jgi:hypothetical protein
MSSTLRAVRLKASEGGIPANKEVNMTHFIQPTDPLGATAQTSCSAGLRCPWQQALAALSFGVLAAVCFAPVLMAAPVHEPLEITPCRVQLVSLDPSLKIF